MLHLIFPDKVFLFKFELRRYRVLDLTLFVEVSGFSIQKSSIQFSLIFIVYQSVLIVLLVCSVRVNFVCLLKL